MFTYKSTYIYTYIVEDPTKLLYSPIESLKMNPTLHPKASKL